MDFTLKKYRLLLETLKKKGYRFVSFSQYIGGQSEKTLRQVQDHNLQSNNSPTSIPYNMICILRHDVDRFPENSLTTAEIENELNIVVTYYFRIVPESFNKEIIKQIAVLGHEIGYHYEDVDLIIKNRKLKIRNKDDKELMIDLAYNSFCKHLEFFRTNFDIKTVCMHGSPISKFDNKLIWTKYNYKELGVIGEPYFDIDWKKFGYLTDTGRKWNGADSSVRDKVKSNFKFNFKTTKDIINNIDELPKKVMLTFHPQRWNNYLLPWLNEYLSQNAKNIIKKYFFVES